MKTSQIRIDQKFDVGKSMYRIFEGLATMLIDEEAFIKVLSMCECRKNESL